MATRLKTVRFAHVSTASVVDNTLTALTALTMDIPEGAGTITFRSCICYISFNGGETVAGNYTSRRIDVSINGAGAATHTNANLWTGSGEQQCGFFAGEFAAHFTTNWGTNTSRSVAVSVLIDGTGTGPVWRDVACTWQITYEYSDAQTTQVKSICIPLDAPVGTLATSKPGAATATIPALDTELPERAISVKNMWIELEGNRQLAGSTTDTTISMQIEALAAYTSSSEEAALASDVWMRRVWNITALGVTTSATAGFYLWASAALYNHSIAKLWVTYTFSAAPVVTTIAEDLDNSETGVDVADGSTYAAGMTIVVDNEQMRVTGVAANTLTVTRGVNGSAAATHSNGASVYPVAMVSLLLPANSGSGPMGGTTSADYQRVDAELWIQEKGTPRTRQLAFFPFWEQNAIPSGINMRLGTGSFITYTDGGSAALAGGNGAMVRNDSAFTLARGRQTLTADAYRTGTTNLATAFSGYFVVNYMAGMPTAVEGQCNHTVAWNAGAYFDGSVAASSWTLAAFAPVIPETNYFMPCVGLNFQNLMNSTGIYQGVAIDYEKTSGEGGVQWKEGVTIGAVDTDPETGLRQFFACIPGAFLRWPSDPDTRRLNLETSRRWRINGTLNVNMARYLDLIFTYHSITYALAGSITDSGAGTVTIVAHRTSDGEELGATSRSGNGAYSITWFDNVENCFVEAYEDGTHMGRSADGVAA